VDVPEGSGPGAGEGLAAPLSDMFDCNAATLHDFWMSVHSWLGAGPVLLMPMAAAALLTRTNTFCVSFPAGLLRCRGQRC
jgi:hypothetical protein